MVFKLTSAKIHRCHLVLINMIRKWLSSSRTFLKNWRSDCGSHWYTIGNYESLCYNGKSSVPFWCSHSQILFPVQVSQWLTEKVNLGRFRTQCESISPASQTDNGNKSFADAVLLTPEHIPAWLIWIGSQTSNIVETIQQTKNVRTPLRNRILPIHLEENLYRAVNQKYWNIDTLSSVFKTDW